MAAGWFCGQGNPRSLLHGNPDTDWSDGFPSYVYTQACTHQKAVLQAVLHLQNLTMISLEPNWKFISTLGGNNSIARQYCMNNENRNPTRMTFIPTIHLASYGRHLSRTSKLLKNGLPPGDVIHSENKKPLGDKYYYLNANQQCEIFRKSLSREWSLGTTMSMKITRGIWYISFLKFYSTKLYVVWINFVNSPWTAKLSCVVVDN